MTTSAALPSRCAIVPVGAPGCGKTALLSRLATELADHGFRFGPDDVRRLAFGTRAYLGAGQHVHSCARSFFAARLAANRSAAYDATNTTRAERRLLLDIAQRQRAFSVALLFRVADTALLRRNLAREVDAVVPEHVVLRYHARVEALRATVLAEEGFRLVIEVAVRDGEFAVRRVRAAQESSEEADRVWNALETVTRKSTQRARRGAVNR